MTVGQLLAKLKDLPEDMLIQVINEFRQDPVDIVTLTQGSWEYPVEIDTTGMDPDDVADEYWEQEPEFRQKDIGKIAVIVTW